MCRINLLVQIGFFCVSVGQVLLVEDCTGWGSPQQTELATQVPWNPWKPPGIFLMSVGLYFCRFTSIRRLPLLVPHSIDGLAQLRRSAAEVSMWRGRGAFCTLYDAMLSTSPFHPLSHSAFWRLWV